MTFCKKCGQELNMAGDAHECYPNTDLGTGKPLVAGSACSKLPRIDDKVHNAETMRNLSVPKRKKN